MGSFMKALGRRSTNGSEVAVRRSRSRFNRFDSAPIRWREKKGFYLSFFTFTAHIISCSHESDMYKHVLGEGSRVSTDSASRCMVRDVWHSSVCRSVAPHSSLGSNPGTKPHRTERNILNPRKLSAEHGCSFSSTENKARNACTPQCDRQYPIFNDRIRLLPTPKHTAN